MLTLIVFLLILAVLVFVHEFGHFFAAKKFGMKVEEFGFGFPPRAKELFEKGGTLYTLNWLPLGGFVKIKGESGDHREDSDSFAAKKAWERLIVLVAGVSMNIVLAWLLLSFGFGLGLPQVVDDENAAYATDQQIQIVSVESASPAGSVGLEPGDVVLSVDNTSFATVKDLQDYIQAHADRSLALSVERGNQVHSYDLQPQLIDGTDYPVLGVGLVKTGIVSYPWYQALWEGMKATYFTTLSIVFAFGGMLASLFTTGSLGADIAGPVGIAVLTGQVVHLGFIYILQFAALLSINLAIINILPIPALDGGRVLFLGIEKLLRRPVDQKTEAIVHNIGFALLMLLIVLVTFKDIGRFGGSIWEGIKNLF